MKGWRVAIWLWAAVAPALATGCGSTAPSRFYTLGSTATAADAGGGSAGAYSVIVGPVAIPASVDRSELVVQTAPNRVDVDEFNRWASPLADSIARTVAGDLAVMLGTPSVAVAPLANFDPDYRVTIDVQRFDSIQGEAALVEAVWVVRSTASGTTRAGRTVAREALASSDFDAFAAAHSRALAQVSRDIAAAIRSVADAQKSAPPLRQGAGTTR